MSGPRGTRPASSDPWVLEHVNMTVRDIDESIRFFTTAFPHFRVRGRSGADATPAWVHVGNDSVYIALNAAPVGATPLLRKPAHLGFNHAGFVIDDAEALRTRMLSAGFREGYVAPTHPHRRRVYFLDADDNEFEFVQYFSNDPRERNAYES